MPQLINFIIRCICAWVVLWCGISPLVHRYAPNHINADSIRFVLATLLPWIATCLIVKRYLEDKKSAEPNLELVSCGITSKNKLEIILVNTSASFINVIEWSYMINGVETIVFGHDRAIPRHSGSSLFLTTVPNELPIEKIRVWTAQRQLPWSFFPPFRTINI